MSNISGVWSGRFWLDTASSEDVPISAWLTSADGRLTGSTLEPSSFVSDEDRELDASIRGHLDGTELTFLKTYQGLKREPIYCEAKLLDDGARIIGRWYFGWPDEVTGAFEMYRDLTQTRRSSASEAVKEPS